MENFDNILKIDKMALDEEWLKQAMLYNRWSTNHSQAILERDREKQKLDLLRTEIDTDVRANLEKYGLKKGTESEIANCVSKQDTYQEGMKTTQDAVYKVNVLGGALEALNHKKAALENLTKLFLAGYYTRDVLSMEAKDSMNKAAENSQRKSLEESTRLRRK